MDRTSSKKDTRCSNTTTSLKTNMIGVGVGVGVVWCWCGVVVQSGVVWGGVCGVLWCGVV